MLLTPAEIKPNSFEMIRNSFLLLFFFFSGCASYLRACLGARLLPHPNFPEGADRVGVQLRGDKDYPLIWQSLEEGAGKRCSESESDRVCTYLFMRVCRCCCCCACQVSEKWPVAAVYHVGR